MFNARLRTLRENLDLTQDDLAKKLNLTQSTIAYYESGKKTPTLDNAKVIADFFGVSLDYLIDRDIPKKDTVLTDEDIFTLAAHAEGHEGALSEEDMDNIKMAIRIALAKKNKG